MFTHRHHDLPWRGAACAAPARGTGSAFGGSDGGKVASSRMPITGGLWCALPVAGLDSGIVRKGRAFEARDVRTQTVGSISA
jgi:hypothetical protein